MSYSGTFKPKNPQKYRGNANNIIYRSTWEARYMTWLDNSPSVIWWTSEELAIPYISPIDEKRHRYFVDFVVNLDTKTGPKVFMIEIKPFKQTQEPKAQKRITKKYLTEVATWGINQAKWKAAEDYCLDRKWTFKILTENELFNSTNK